MDTIKYAHIISHTHWDREWYLNSKYTNEWLVPFFDSLFKMMEKEPQYRFVLDGQTLMIEDYLEQLNLQGKNVEQSKLTLKKYVSEKRLIIGPYYLQPDWQLISEESAIRNLLIGRQIVREFGGSTNTGWLLDNFGQISQAPQIHEGFNLQGLFVWRGVELQPANIKSEFYWQAPDGTRILAIYFLGSYRNAMRLAERDTIIAGRIKSEVEKIQPFAATPNVLLMNGYDQEMEPDDILPHIKDGTSNFGDFKVIQSTPDEYIAAVKKAEPDLPTLKGALYSGRYISVFPGVLSSRMYLKTQNDLCQKKLEKYAEPLETVLWCLGSEYHQEQLLNTWKLLLKNHPHDSICGVSIDDVHTDMEKRLAESNSQAEVMVYDCLKKLVCNIDTGKYENTIGNFIVINTSLQKREGIVTLKDEFPAEICVKDSLERCLPLQRNGKGGLDILVKEIPALGYETIFILPKPESTDKKLVPEGPVSFDVTKNLIENRYLKVQIHPDGSLKVTDKLTDEIYDEMVVFEDGADAGDEYNYSYPEQDLIFTSKDKKADICFFETGPLKVVVKIECVLELPEELTPNRKTRCQRTKKLPIVTWLTVKADSPLLEFRTEVCNTIKDHRLRVLFPTRLQSEFSYAEVQFDVTERQIIPDKYEDALITDNIKRIIIGAREPQPTTIFPQRTFVDIHNGERGISVLNQGLPEYEILPENNTIALTLFRGVSWIARPDLKTRIGDAGPMIAVPDAQCLRTMEFNYALYFHRGDWQTGKVTEVAEQFNTKFLIVKTDRHQGVLPDRLGFMEIDRHGVLKVTAVKRSEDATGIIIRLHNPAETAVEGSITSFFKIKNAYYTDLDETNIEFIEVSDNQPLRLQVKPKKIVSIKLELEQTRIVTNKYDANIQIYNDEIKGRNDFGKYQRLAAVTDEDVNEEEKRAAELEGTFLLLREKALEYQQNMEIKNVRAQLDLFTMQLDAETHHRASLEARLSAIFLKKKYLELYHLSDGLYEKYLEEVDPVIRKVGYELSRSRVDKRSLDYIVDFYNHLANEN